MATCNQCKHAYAIKGKADISGAEIIQGYECHRYPPQLSTIHQLPVVQGGQIQAQVMPVFPRIDGGNFCGEFSGREAANV